MDTQKNYACLEHNNRIFTKSFDNDFDYQEALPAYCDDIFRVVKCLCHSYITSAEINYNEVKLYGKNEISLTYYNEESGLCFADFEEEFTKAVSVENLSDSAFSQLEITDKYTNFRVINQRRIDIHTSVNIRLSVYDKVKCPCVASCENAKLRREVTNVADVIGAKLSRIEFDEEFPLANNAKPIKRIISSFAFATLNETKIIKDKALVKALVSLSVLYTDEEEEINKCEYSFNVSKIIEASGIDEDDYMIAEVSVDNVILKAKATGGDACGVIDAFGELSLQALFIRESEEALITDGYVLNRLADCQYSDYACRTDGKYITDSRSVNLSYDMPEDIREVLELSVALSDTVIKNGQLTAKATVTVIGATSAAGYNSFSATKTVELDADGATNAYAALSLQSYDYTLNASGALDVRMAIGVSAYTYQEGTRKVLSDIEAQEEYITYPSLTVYFGKKDESVWNIAKRFSSDIDAIVRENELSGDILEGNQILIIPKV